MNQLWKINRIIRLLAALTLAALPLVLAAPAGARADIVVISTADSGMGTLRWAIIQANTNTGADTIRFNLGRCALYCTISPTTALPPLSGGDTTIDGYTQPDAAPAADEAPATIVVELDGSLSPAIYGLGITSAGNTIQGLAITRFKGTGIAISGAAATGNVIAGNHIGVTPSADLTLGNLWDGVYIGEGAMDNLVGGDTYAERNIIGGNGWDGVGIYGAGSDRNVVSGNYIGNSGADALGNVFSGVHIYGGARSNRIGGFVTLERNVISANGLHGVNIAGAGTDGNRVAMNLVGLDYYGLAAIGNAKDGINISQGAQLNLVGGYKTEGNIIAANLENGVQITGTNTLSNTVSGNNIGAYSTSGPDVGNDQSGVLIGGGAGNTLVGGEMETQNNVISGNERGVKITGSETAHNTVSGNLIGVDFNGTSRLPNTHHGVWIGEGAHHNRIGGVNATPGGECSGECNLISGNNHEGLVVGGDLTSENVISGNYIGTDRTGMIRLDNSYGIIIYNGAQHTTIGGDTPGERNLISGNFLSGIIIYDSATKHTVVTGNNIGTNAGGTGALSNGEHGIEIVGAGQYRIGGEAPGEGNLISGNGENGIDISESSGDTENKIISGNIIGLDASGSSELGNGLSGVSISISANNLIGGETSAGGNTISGNGAYGVRITGGSRSNQLCYNRIGTSLDEMVALGNAQHGVIVEEGSQENIIGPENLIQSNAADGVQIDAAVTYANVVTMNAIGENVEDGIDLVSGANHDIQPPVIDALAGSTLSVVISGSSCAGCIVEVFGNMSADGEGQFYLDSDVAGAGGQWSLEVDRLFYSYLTATATALADGTSEFSAVFANPYRYVFMPMVVR